jgi:hypothetical protein
LLADLPVSLDARQLNDEAEILILWQLLQQQKDNDDYPTRLA